MEDLHREVYLAFFFHLRAAEAIPQGGLIKARKSDAGTKDSFFESIGRAGLSVY